MREQLRVPDDWSYISYRLPIIEYNKLIRVAGSNNIKFISGTQISDKIRFSIFVSPRAIRELDYYCNYRV